MLLACIVVAAVWAATGVFLTLAYAQRRERRLREELLMWKRHYFVATERADRYADAMWPGQIGDNKTVN